jgi:hypothetical protein
MQGCNILLPKFEDNNSGDGKFFYSRLSNKKSRPLQGGSLQVFKGGPS